MVNIIISKYNMKYINNMDHSNPYFTNIMGILD